MNYMEGTAKLLGLELGEAFSIKDFEEDTYRLTESGTEFFNPCSNEWELLDEDSVLPSILNGEESIVYFTFKARYGEIYWFACWDEYNVAVDSDTWCGSDEDCQRFFCGNCFRNEDEAEDNKYKIYEKITGKVLEPGD